MLVKLWGLSWQSQTKSVINMLEDANVRFDFVDVEDTDSPRMEQIIALTGDKELPQLFVEGVAYVGKQEIRRYLGA
jgi:glutaredoxin